MGHLDALARQDLHTILEPLPCDLIIRHLALEHGLVRRLDCQISNVLQHLQLFFCRRVGVGGKKKHRTRVQAGVREKPSRAEALDGNSLTPAAISFTFVLEPLDPEACGSNQLHPQHGKAGG